MSKYLKSFLFVGAILLLALNQGCKKGVSLSETDFKDMYSSNSDVPQPRFKVFHASKSETEIHYMFENRGLTYSSDLQSEDYMAQVRIAWQLYNNYTNKEVIDSSSFVKIDTIAIDGLYQLQGVFNISVDQGADYILKITTTDLNNSQKTISFININKKDVKNRQFFKVILKENNSVLFRNYFYKNEKLAIVYNNSNITTLIGKNYKTRFPVSSPPFSLSSPKPFNFDDFYSIELDVINDTAQFEADEAGVYHFGIDNTSKYSGVTLFQYSDEFPEVNNSQEMLEPLRFITSRKEYGRMVKYQNTKKAVDEFWLSTSSDPNKAKKLVKGYYNRVESANYYYTSYKEGWKTDRGIIYIVFGPPGIVYRSLTGESWTYGEQSNFKSLTFNFSKINNPFTNNDYVLQRSTVYKNPWYRAIDAWRQGKVTSLEY
jgi:GWxTD domain-containing protein